MNSREIITEILDLNKRHYRGFRTLSQRKQWEDDSIDLMMNIMTELNHRNLDERGKTNYVLKAYLDGVGDEHIGVECQHCKAIVNAGNFCSQCGWSFHE